MRVVVAMIVAATSVSATSAAAAAQSFADLLVTARYEEAASSLQDATPEEARVGATQIFEQVYRLELERGRFTQAARGFAAARRAPHLEASLRQMLDFWQGMALFASVRDSAPSDGETAAVLAEAQALLRASADYVPSVALPAAVSNVERALDLSGRARARDGRLGE